jgi:pimeloyl-ACP methyl ester carboxylesterase
MSTARNGSLSLYWEDVAGSVDAPVLLLVNGLGNQCIAHRREMCETFAREGFRVIRFDNRDVGLSDDGPDGYGLSDMADDAVAVLDAAGVDRAVVMGSSLGGMIVQTLAIEHPERLLAAVSVMSTTGDPDVGRPSEEARRLLLTPGAVDREAAIEAHLAGQRTWGSPGLVEWDEQRRLAGEMFDRACRPDGVARQYRAARRDGSRSERLSNVTVPMLVLHGTADTLIDHSGGVRTAEVVPGATLVTIEGMGHDHPRGLWDRLATEVRMFAVQCGILGGAA